MTICLHSRPRAGIVAVALIALWVAAPGAGAAEPSETAGTVEVRGSLVALQGVYCEKPGSELGDRAASFIADQVAREGVLRCKLTDEDVFGLPGGRCEKNGKDIGEALISTKLCGHCPAHDPDGQYSRAASLAGTWEGSLPEACTGK